MEPNNHSFTRSAILCSAAFLALLTTGCIGLHSDIAHPPEFAEVKPGAVPQWSDGRAPSLEDIIRKQCVPYITNGHCVGLSVAVLSGTNKTIMGFGRACATNDVLAKDDTIYEIGSITKTFTALALAREIERGTVQLEQPIAEFMPAGLELSKDARDVTFRHLTSHTSGLPGQPDNFSLWHTFWLFFRGRNPYGDYTEKQFREAIRTMELDSKPGTHCEYSNFGMDILGYLLTQHAGLSYEAYIKREVCEPLGLSDTTVTFSTNQAARFAQGYIVAERKKTQLTVVPSVPWDLPSYLSGSGALRSTATDMLKYLEAQMHPTGPLAHAIDETHRELFRAPKSYTLAMNWVLSYKNGKTYLWHNGAMGGCSSYMAFTKDGTVGVAVLGNIGAGGDGPVDTIGQKLLTDLIKLQPATGSTTIP
jgi:CubicO group peptidase (beta-lactamase class C family)